MISFAVIKLIRESIDVFLIVGFLVIRRENHIVLNTSNGIALLVKTDILLVAYSF
jgi:hypothetical protein